MIETPFIFNKGLPGSRDADNLEGIITNVFIDFLYLIKTIKRGKIVQ